MKYLLFILGFFISIQSFATHNRAGEITYKQISDYTYEITLITYTWTPSSANEYRDSILMAMGDGTAIYIKRIREEFLPDDYTKNTYKVTHTYPGSGSYNLVMEDPNRNQGIVNIFDSVNIPFSIRSTLTIDPIVGFNNTPVLLNPPVDNAALGEVFIHNPAAFDPDGDSLAYKLTFCTGEGGVEIPKYTYPAASNKIYVDSITGDLIWDAPVEVGRYNVAMVVEEWREGVKIGEVVRDLQIEVFNTENKTPKIDSIEDVCVRALDTVRFSVTASDSNGDNISLTATGGPFTFINNPATFTDTIGNSAITGEFMWSPTCDAVREQPYSIIFKVTDSNTGISLSNQRASEITVIGHPPENVQVIPDINTNTIVWDSSLCNNMIGFELYRATSSQPYDPGYCETGIPESLDYEMIAFIHSNSDYSYLDDNNGEYLGKGYRYCYRMLAIYADSSQSYISNETCTTLLPGLPDFTNVSVENTDSLYGNIFIAWTKPEFDTLVYDQPYKYELLRSIDSDASVFTTIHEMFDIDDTTFFDTLLNTLELHYRYKLQFYYSDGGDYTLLGSPPAASQPVLSLTPANNELLISVDDNTPWTNYSYIIYRKDTLSDIWEIIDTTATGFYRDYNLVNDSEYCYKVETRGKYDIGNFPDTLINFSQEVCGIPQDTTAPLPVEFDFWVNCDNELITINWENPTDKDSLEQIQFYTIYYKTCIADNYSEILRIAPETNSISISFKDSTRTMGGCYYISATDSAGNESSLKNDTCIYNCPKYLLPNVFTPNGDGENDLYTPRLNKYVEKVDMKIFNRWGQLMFETDDPEINWNGTGKHNEQLPDGVFYYVCEVYEWWLNCKFEPRRLIGFIHKFSDTDKSPNSNEE